MKYALITAMLAGLVCVGCTPKAKAPKTVEPELVAPGPVEPMTSTPAPLPPVTKPTPLVGPETGPMTNVTPIAPAPAVPTPAATPAGGTYVIKKGDTFIKIAREIYGNPSRMKDIAAANPGVNPRKLMVGQTIILPDVAPTK